ncbi:CinA family protein [Phenylobacterium aquaticum]|uniref:CinA family protein n=1 Tax=Phenylobacterium aquaticum TaxID=1763816 RepID=UPI0026E9D192|nr:CinA family protein [Phenylobacterium aquaticum]
MNPLLIELGEAVGQALKARRETVAVAESSSGGLVSAALLSVGGASAYYLGGGVVYTAKARFSLLEIPREAIPAGMRSASEPYALLLARTVRERFGATWGVSETGAAGPTGNPYGDAAGHTCVAISGPVEFAATIETGSPDRLANMDAFAAAALDLLKRAAAA